MKEFFNIIDHKVLLNNEILYITEDGEKFKGPQYNYTPGRTVCVELGGPQKDGYRHVIKFICTLKDNRT